MDRDSESRAIGRIRLLARLAAIWAVVLLGRLVYLQVVAHADINEIADRQHRRSQEVQAPRGRLLDRNGQTLAISVDVDSIAINPRQTPDLAMARDILAPLLGLDAEPLGFQMEQAAAADRGFLWIKRKISREESRRLRTLSLPWIQFIPETRRSYPNESLAAHVLGTVDHEGEGNSGLEQSLNDELRGKSGKLLRLRDARNRGVDSQVLSRAHAGTDFGLTIDERIQFVADQALARAAQGYGAPSGSLVVLEPYSGEILALSNYPTFDPNAERVTERDVAARKNNAISAPFEPGSVFKTVTLAAALESTGLGPESLIDCGPGVIRLFGRSIHDLHAYGTIPMRTVLAKSSNIGAIQIGLEAGEEKLHEYVQRFGFGRRTGIPLPGESAGLVWGLDSWSRTSIGSVAMGHEVLATSLQLALATAVFANGGTLPEPRLILWREQPGEGRIAAPAATPRRVVEPQTAIAMRRMMEEVVLDGTGRQARLAGYSSGGKTGSAQIYDPEVGVYTHEYNSSFVGFAPVQDPKIVVVVTLNGAGEYGGVVSAPVFREVAAESLRILGVVPDVPNQETPRELDPRELEDLAIADLGGGAPGVAVDEPGEPQVTAYVRGPEVPDLYGLALRDVLSECARRGLEVEYQGAGLARSQDPAPGTVLPVGRRVRVVFAR